MKTQFDYVIVGGSSAGCVLANRLSENPKVRVLLLQAGKKTTSADSHSYWLDSNILRLAVCRENRRRYTTIKVKL